MLKFFFLHYNKLFSCNAVVTRLAITRLSSYVIHQLQPTLQPISIILRSYLVSNQHQLFKGKKFYLSQRAVANQAECLSTSLLGDYLQINTFLILVLVERELQLMLYKATGGAVVAVREKGRLDVANMTLGMSTLASTYHRCLGQRWTRVTKQGQ